MHINQSEERKHSQVSYLQARSASVDSGFGDEEVINKTDIQTALEKIKKGKQKFKEWQKESSADISNIADISSIKDKEGNNILHLVALLKRKQKCRSLKVLIEGVSEEDLVKLVDSKNKEEKTPLQVALIDKIKKEKRGSRTIRSNDNTLKFVVALLKQGTKPDQLELSQQILQSLDEKQESYYRKFLKKIVKSVGKSELDPETKNSVIIKAGEIIYDGYPLHKTVLKNDKEEFSKLLRSGCNIANQDRDGNNVLHLVTELGKKQKLEFFDALLKAGQEKQLIEAINDKNNNNQTPLHQLLQRIKEKSEDQSCTDRKFEKTNRYKTLELLLRNGADITAEDKEGNNALHYIALFKGEQKVACLDLILGLVEGGKIPGNRLREAIDAKNKNEKEQTPLHQLLQHMQKKSKKSSLESTNRYKTLELLLKNGADITAKDKEGNNALHYIASLEGKQKVTCLDLILELSKNNLSLKVQLSEAIKTKNQEERTPLQVVLIKKAEKGNHLSQITTIFDSAINYDNTTKFCARLLQNGANPDSLVLRDEKFHTNNYYLVLRNLKDYREPLQAGRKEAQELKKELEEKYHCGTASKKCQSVFKKAGSAIEKTLSDAGKALSAIGKYMDPASRTRELLTIIITTTVVAMAAFAFFQGQIGVGAAVSMIAIAGVICLTLTLGFNGIKKLFGDSANKDIGSPSSKMENTSTEHFGRSSDITNTPSSPGR